MATEQGEITKFIKRWTITVTYIAVVVTIIAGVKLYEVFIK